MDAPPLQFDLFEHGRDTMLRNDALAALLGRDAAQAHAARATLAAEFPGDERLPALKRLGEELEADACAPLPDHDALAAQRRRLEAEVEPAARDVFCEADAAAWMRPLWGALAARSAALAFVAARVDDHAAPLWLRAADWAAAAHAVQRIESWRRIPVPLAWMLEARCRADGIDAHWPLLADLAWLAPLRLEALLPRLPDALLAQAFTQFGRDFEGDSEDDLAWFPAWLLVWRPALASQLAAAEPGLRRRPETGLRLMVELLGLERQGRHHELVQRRRALRDLHPGLFAAYMATR